MRKMGTVSGHKLDASTETEPFWWLNISIVPNWTPQTCHVSTCENPCENPRVSQLGRSEAEHLVMGNGEPWHMGVSLVIRIPPNEWFTMENAI